MARGVRLMLDDPDSRAIPGNPRPTHSRRAPARDSRASVSEFGDGGYAVENGEGVIASLRFARTGAPAALDRGWSATRQHPEELAGCDGRDDRPQLEQVGVAGHERVGRGVTRDVDEELVVGIGAERFR